MPTSENIIDELIVAVYGYASGSREQFVFLQALHGLVRLAKTEQMLEVRMNVERAAGASAGSSSRRQTRAILRRIGLDCNARQGQFQFDGEDDPNG